MENVLEIALDKIKNVYPGKIEELRNLCNDKNVNNPILAVKIIKDFLGLKGSLNSKCYKYWFLRGWPDLEIKKILHSKRVNAKKNGKKRISPFSKEFWINRGYNEEAAVYKANSLRPIRKEYWLEKGFEENEAIAKSIEAKNTNNKRGGNAKKSYHSIWDKNYWIKIGFSEEDAIAKVSSIQSAYTLDDYIRKYGEELGKFKYYDRQTRWQNTLKNKSKEETNDINSRKNPLTLKNFNNISECIDKLKSSRNMILHDNIEDFKNSIIEKQLKKPHLLFIDPEIYISKNIPKIQFEIFDKLNIKNIKDEIKDLFKILDKEFVTLGGKYTYKKRIVKEGALRGAHEIYFYDLFREKYPNKEISVNKQYEKSNFRFDFKIDDIYIEICPMYYDNKNYRMKIDHKKEVFNCVLLKNVKDIKDFIERI